MPDSFRPTRRQFVIGGLASATVVGAAAAGYETHPLQRWLHGDGDELHAGSGVLVLVTLYGGNDGLNTVVPIADARYHDRRAALAVAPEKALALDHQLGLHPSLAGFHDLWKKGHLAIVRGVGYPNPNRSHFVSMDIWQSGVPDRPVPTGWLGRWLDKTGTGPLRAMVMGPTVPRALMGANGMATAIPSGSLALPGGDRTARLVADMARPDPGASPLAAEIARSESDFVAVQGTIGQALGASQPNGAAPSSGAGNANNPLASQLDTVRALIEAGVPGRVYSVSLSGWDTHANQSGPHARLLAQLDGAVSGFLSSLAGKPHAKAVTVAVYSEFGRRVAANASGGTDHGTAAPLFVAGPAVKGGFYGEQPSLAALDANGDLTSTVDFRSVYSTLLSGVLGAHPDVAIDGRFPALGFV